MIEIYINNQKADFFGSFTIKKDNPLFSNFDVEPTEHTYTLTLPTTATNAKIFSLIQYTLATPQKLPARIEIDGVQVLEGSCNVQSWNDSGYNVYFSGIAPYEDANISPVKKMLDDTRLLGDLFEFPTQMELQYGVGEYNGYDGNLVSGDANTFFLDLNNELTEGAVTSNVCFNVKYLIDEIAKYFKINITTPSLLADLFICQLGEKDVYTEVFEGITNVKIRLQSSVPRLTPLQLLTNVSSACGYKLQVNYKTNTITFFSLNEMPTGYSSIEGELKDINYNSTPNSGVIKFKEVAPLEYNNDKGIEMAKQYSQDGKVVIGSDDKVLFENLLSKMIVPQDVAFEGAVVMPVNYSENDKRFDNIAIVGFDREKKYVIAPNLGDADFHLWQKIATLHTSIKLTAQLNPIQFTTLDMWKPVFVENIGSVFIKSINFKSDGESEIECYLY